MKALLHTLYVKIFEQTDIDKLIALKEYYARKKKIDLHSVKEAHVVRFLIREKKIGGGK